MKHSVNHHPYYQVSDISEAPHLEPNEDVRYVDTTVTIVGITHGIVLGFASKKEERKINARGESPLEEPVLAVVSGSNVVSSELSHLLSMPLKSISPSFQSKTGTFEFMALWPSDPDQNEQPTLTFTRQVKRSRNYHMKEVYSYSCERLVLALSLMKGNEIITLGQVSIPFSYSEKKVHVLLPVRTDISLVKQAAAEIKGLKVRPKKMKNNRSKRSNFVKPLAFCDDPKRVYSFRDDSMLSVLVQTEPTERIMKENYFTYEQNQRTPNVEAEDDSSHTVNSCAEGKSSQRENSKTDKSSSTCSQNFQSSNDFPSPTDSISDISLDDSEQSDSLIADTFVSINGNVNTSISDTRNNDVDKSVPNLNTMHERMEWDTKMPENFEYPSFKRVESAKFSNRNNDDYFPTVKVNSSSVSSDSPRENELQSVSAATGAKDDTQTTSSWTLTSWTYHDFIKHDQ